MNIHTNLEETTFGGEDGDMAIVAASTSSAHFLSCIYGTFSFLFRMQRFDVDVDVDVDVELEEKAFSPRDPMLGALY